MVSQSQGAIERKRTNNRRRRNRDNFEKKTHAQTFKKKILLLHGNRQSGQLFLGRVEKLRKRVSKDLSMDFVSPDAPFPHPEDSNLRTWWNRDGNTYEGLDQSLDSLKIEIDRSDEEEIVGVIGFSQGARMAHLVALLHSENPKAWLPGLKFIILVAGYDAPVPDGFRIASNIPKEISTPSLHVWGLADPLITPEQSEAVTSSYVAPQTYIHPGKHYVPSKTPDIQVFVDFMRQNCHRQAKSSTAIVDKVEIETTNNAMSIRTDLFTGATESVSNSLGSSEPTMVPDEESALMQQEEVQALEAIFPEEIELKSSKREVDFEAVFVHPIIYEMKLLPSGDSYTHWPPRPLVLRVVYPHNYPLEAIPKFYLIHDNNGFEFPSSRVIKFKQLLNDTATMELGMPSVLSCIYAVKEYLDSPASEDESTVLQSREENDDETDKVKNLLDDDVVTQTSTIRLSSPAEIQKCTIEGLSIAEHLLTNSEINSSFLGPDIHTLKGGSFGTYTIGLVGKPSAGKSTFFNAATAFSRQRGDTEGDSEWGGASMAAHPFTTIDPNIGYCLVPAPFGSCPEDDVTGASSNEYGSTHGRDPHGRRFIPVLLKDVAGLVPGAYQGRGRGNQFLNDLTDATVLIHVVDASGTADAQGNTTVTGDDCDFTNPLDDLAWIRNELVEWVYSNLEVKWDTISRKGRGKLLGMFSGYGQTQAVTQRVFSALEKFLDDTYQRDNALDQVTLWNQADIHRLVSAFLGVRFPMALALNKHDLPSSKKHSKEILSALPVHGAHTATPLTARHEMNFVRQYLTGSKQDGDCAIPSGCWQCLTSAMMLREPVLVFPVSDMTTYAPLMSLNKEAIGNPSLPSKGMIRCIKASGGSSPTCWNDSQEGYFLPSKKEIAENKLRDVILMKPGSTVEDVFFALKNLGALSGDFVRAEAACRLGDKPKPIPKNEIIGRKSRILKIMSNKRSAWQT